MLLRFKDNSQLISETHLRAETYHYKIDRGEQTPCDVYRNASLYDSECVGVVVPEERSECGGVVVPEGAQRVRWCGDVGG